MDLDLAMEFIDLCIDNYKNGGHSTTKEQEHRYYRLKHQFQDDHEKARKWDELLLRNAHIDFGEWLQDTKLRELIEKRIIQIQDNDKMLWIVNELQKLLEGSKK